MGLRDLLLAGQEKRLREKKQEAYKNLTVGASVGLAIGTVIGVLFAPKAGKETRQDIAVKAKEAVDVTKGQVEEAKVKITQFVDEQKERLSAIKTDVFYEAAATLDHAADELEEVAEKLEEVAEERNVGVSGKQTIAEEA